jgi:hypothetical protein
VVTRAARHPQAVAAQRTRTRANQQIGGSQLLPAPTFGPGTVAYLLLHETPKYLLICRNCASGKTEAQCCRNRYLRMGGNALRIQRRLERTRSLEKRTYRYWSAFNLRIRDISRESLVPSAALFVFELEATNQIPRVDFLSQFSRGEGLNLCPTLLPMR